MRSFFLLLFIFFLNTSCDKALLPESCSYCLHEISSSEQRTGNAKKGKEYLLYGDFVDSGIPGDLFVGTLGAALGKEGNLLRSGINNGLNYAYTRFINKDGIDLVAPNCFQCHAGFVDNQFVLGLGNMQADFTINQAGLSNILDQIVSMRYGANSKEVLAYEPFSRAVKVLSDKLATQVVGSNSADKLALILAAHRNQTDLSWLDEPNFTIPDEVFPVDVPAWWLLKKKNAMFHTAEGRGDFARLMMASSLLTLQDSTKAREVDNHFADVRAFLNTLDPPPYPGEIDTELAQQGEVLFKKECSSCHGTYGNDVHYPNLLVDRDEIGTDDHVIEFYKNNQEFVQWYNGSWFSKQPYAARLEPGNGYIAPPLDGIWATAPYFHNGSVPTLFDVLQSSERPGIWKKSGGKDNYDHQKMGLRITVETAKADKFTYDTSLPGYGKQGHEFGDHFTPNERKAVVEYLKTL